METKGRELGARPRPQMRATGNREARERRNTSYTADAAGAADTEASAADAADTEAKRLWLGLVSGK